ncbi:uncharacterized protein LOC144592179 [Rhinoraja longicauda]
MGLQHSARSHADTDRLAPAKLRREFFTHRLVCKAPSDAKHPLHHLAQDSQQLGPQHLSSRHPFSRHAATLCDSGFNILGAWRTSWEQTSPPPQFTVGPNTTASPGSDTPRKEWVTLNRLHTGVGRINANVHRWGLCPSAACVCGADQQTAQHGILDCTVLRPPGGGVDLTALDNSTLHWLQRLEGIT